jgi:hypothetical protein
MCREPLKHPHIWDLFWTDLHSWPVPVILIIFVRSPTAPAMLGGKAAMKEEPLNEKHPCEDTSLSFHDRICAGADPNELDHDLGGKRTGGERWPSSSMETYTTRLTGVWTGCSTTCPPSRWCCDTELIRVWERLFFSQSALFSVMVGQHHEYAPKFYDAAWEMLDRVAKALEGECRRDDLWSPMLWRERRCRVRIVDDYIQQSEISNQKGKAWTAWRKVL